MRSLIVHLRGAFLMTRAAQMHMTQEKWGRIVNISSTSALGQPRAGQLRRSESRLDRFHQDPRAGVGQVRRDGKCDCSSGFVETEMTQTSAARQGLDYEEWKLAAAREIPVGRIGKPEDVAAVASFLCREEAGYVSGQVIYVNGGAKS